MRRTLPVLPALLACIVLVVLLDVGGLADHWGPFGIWMLIAVECGLGVALLLWHATGALGATRGTVFVLLAALLGWAAEAVSVNTTVSLFGGRYAYEFPGPHVMGVPLPIPTFWAIFLYGVYAVSNSFLHWTGRGKPRRGRGGLLGPLILLDGALLVAIDLVLDPLQCGAGRWRWLDGGPYYGIPLGNFAGWFAVSVAMTGSFRLFEYIRPTQPPPQDDAQRLLPPLCYGLLALILAAWALNQDRTPLAVLAILLMAPVAGVNLLLFARRGAGETSKSIADG